MVTLDEARGQIIPGRPLLLVDADEVLLRFVERLGDFLGTQGYDLHLRSFSLGGNIVERVSGVAAAPKDVKRLIGHFFEACAHDVPIVPGAASALDSLADSYQIFVLSNIPAHCAERRAQNLRDHGILSPVIANAGEKGPAVRLLSAQAQAPTVFVDDLPPQHASVAAHAPESHRVHFIADPRLRALVGKAEDAHVRLDEWPALSAYLLDHLGTP